MLDCEATSRLIVPAFRIAVAKRLVKDYGLSQSRVAALMGVRQASVSNYLSYQKSDAVGRTAAYISSKGLEERLVKLALSGTGKTAISTALERAATDPYLLRHVLSTKGLQIMKKTTSELV
jgi:predicted transcriptional regulator